jgi:hypothetical protein
MQLQMAFCIPLKKNWKSMGLNCLPFSQPVGISTGGAASITRAENRLIQKMSWNISDISDVHYVAQRLNVRTLNSIKDWIYIDELDLVMKKL